MKKRKKVYNLV